MLTIVISLEILSISLGWFRLGTDKNMVMLRKSTILALCGLSSTLFATDVPISDNSFELINVPNSAGNFVFMPPSPNWTFTGADGRAAGVAKGQSSWGSGAAFGNQYAFIQGTGRINRTVSGLTVGKSYQLSSFIARNSGSVPEGRADVIVNGHNIGVMRGYDTAWRSYTFRTFVATSSVASIGFIGTVDNGLSFLLDAVSLREEVKSANILDNGNFNAVSIPNGTWNYEANYITGGGWTYSPQIGESGAGLATVGSPWGSTAFNDNAFGFIQGGGTISQTMKGLIVGNQYAINFAQSTQPNQNHRIRVFVGNTEILGPTGSNSTWGLRQTAFFTATSSEVNLRFAGVDTGNGATTLIDGITVVPEPATLAFFAAGIAALMKRRKAS
jgi:hypothetical protein